MEGASVTWKVVEITPDSVSTSLHEGAALNPGEKVRLRFPADLGYYMVAEVRAGQYVLLPEGTRFQ